MSTSQPVRPEQARIEPVADSDAVRGRFGGRPDRVLNVSRTMARNPDLFTPWSDLARYLAMEGRIPARERELVILRIGWRARAVYEFGQHTLFGRRAGLDDDEIKAVTQELDSGPWNEGERDLLLMADELYDDDCVTDATWQRLAGRWDPAQLVELVTLAGFYRMVSSTLNTLGVQLDEGVPGWP
ncbi:MAG: carboxymuconolactone decarboxylase family protein [Actinomycetota bacterium]|nr:carboxymuconolactone decarboxylase family protein [Actinomycetota bacterium]